MAKCKYCGEPGGVLAPPDHARHCPIAEWEALPKYYAVMMRDGSVASLHVSTHGGRAAITSRPNTSGMTLHEWDGIRPGRIVKPSNRIIIRPSDIATLL